MGFILKLARGRAAQFHLGGYGPLSAGDTARFRVTSGETVLLDLVDGDPSPNGSTLETNGIPTPAGQSAWYEVFLDDSESVDWPLGEVDAEILRTDASKGDELFQVDCGTITVTSKQVATASVPSTLEAAAASPRSVSIDGESVQEHSLRDQIEYDRYQAEKAAAARKRPPIRITKMIPGGTT